MGFTEEAVDQIVIAVDEACSNIIRHAYGGDPAQQIQIVVDTYPDRLEITLSDQGRRFDPSTYREPDPQKLARSGQRGGLGLLLMRRLMDEIQYDYRDEFNIVRLIKYL
jgi:serine/threonine-protein kinase RsbW